MTHSHGVRVYYEDTDLAGIVYYANYLKFIERGRSEMLRAAGFDQTQIKTEADVVFAVRRVVADYLAPARFDDLLDVETEVTDLTAARIVLDQKVTRAGEVLFAAQVTLVALTSQGRPTRLPADVRRALEPE